MFCRLAAQDLSLLGPRLSCENVRLVGVGLEQLGVEEFVEKKFWDGELYIDEKKQSYKDLGFKRFGLLSLPGLLLSRIARTQMAKGKERGVGGDMKGDGYQNGGLIVVEKGGKLLYSYVQENPADHPNNDDILKALNLSPEDGGGAQPKSPTSVSAATTTCEGDVCSIKSKATNAE